MADTAQRGWGNGVNNPPEHTTKRQKGVPICSISLPPFPPHLGFPWLISTSSPHPFLESRQSAASLLPLHVTVWLSRSDCGPHSTYSCGVLCPEF